MNRSTGGALKVVAVAFLAMIVLATIPAQGVNGGFSTGAGAASFQVLTSGPLHESFARPVVFGGTGAYYIPVAPPPLFEEIPPLQRPAGSSEWVAGYWSFDDQHQTWIWVSGTWRVPPPGYTWVTGYWNNSTKGWRYVSGYWALASSVNTEVDYLPPPPEPLDAGVIGTAPDSDSIWAPGNWMWAGSNYSWRNGYYLRARRDWVWTPASYTWTPSGYVFQDAYWDHSLDRRGLLYAPVAFTPGTSLAAGFSFSPDSLINIGLFSDSLFVRPQSDQYYFGDYYATSWWDRGVYPAFAFHMSRYGYDPLFAYASWQGGTNPQWLDGRRAGFLNLQAHPEARPQPGVVAIAAKDAAAAKITPLEIETAPASDRQQFVDRAKAGQQARTERIKLETNAGASAEVTQPRKIKMSKDLLPGAAESGKATMAVPERPEMPRVEAGRRPEGAKGDARRLGEPSIDRPVDHIGRAGGKADPSKAEGEKPMPTKRAEGAPPVVKPDPVNEPPLPKRRDVAPPEKMPDTGKPDGGKPEPRPEPAKRPDGTPPAPKPDGGRSVPQPAKHPDAQPAPKPDGGKQQPLPPPKPDGGKPQPAPAPKPDGGKPAPSPSPQPNGKPDGKPQGKPKLDAPDSRPEGS